MYYPLSQITSNLYTNGGEYIIEATNALYRGYYWKTSQGKYFTGKNPQDGLIQKLIPISTLRSDLDSNILKTNLNEFDENTSAYVFTKKIISLSTKVL